MTTVTVAIGCSFIYSLMIIASGTIIGHTAKPVNVTRREYCLGSSDGKSQVLASGTTTLQRLRNQFQNCTRIYGNLEINYIDQTALDEETADPYTALDFLNSIEEVTGYVLIYANSAIRHISLDRLRIIWGDTLFHEDATIVDKLSFSDPKGGAALHIFANANLETINFRDLRSIERGNVHVTYNPYLCYWQPEPHNRIDFSQLLGDEWRNRLIIVNERQHLQNKSSNALNFAACDNDDDAYVCSNKCNNSRCWGGGEQMCQTIYRDNCPTSCESKMCWESGTEDPKHCCHKACTAGCYGPKHDQCYFCKQVEEDGVCEERCHGITILNRHDGVVEPHPNPRYTFKRHCVAQCPENTLIQGENCVTRCNEGFHADTEHDDRNCRPCERGVCPKACPLSGELSSENIDTLINCTIIEGHILLLQHVMDSHNIYVRDGNGRKLARGLTPADLEKLNHVRIITDYLEVQAGSNSPVSLAFLRNLAVIEGRRLSNNKYAMSIQSNDNLLSLGLTALKQIRKGHVYIGKNHRLCFADSINWSLLIDDRSKTSGESVSKVIENKGATECRNERKVCSTMCNSTMGCWGDGDQQCFACANWRINDNQCVDQCPTDGYYKVIDGKQCKQCHPECHECNAETSRNCTKCRNVRLYHGITDIECLADCPMTHYRSNDAICRPCHRSCFGHRCTGPGDQLGVGGCEKCNYAQVSDDMSHVIRCLPPVDNDKKICSAAGLTQYYIAAPKHNFSVEKYMCAKCKNECSACTGYGTDVVYNGCICARYQVVTDPTSDSNRSHPDVCVNQCPSNSYLDPIMNGTSSDVGRCIRCSDMCDEHDGCRGPKSSDCKRCKSAGIYLDDDMTMFNCTAECPSDKPYLDASLICREVDVLELERIKRARRNLLIGVIIAILLFLLLGAAAVSFVYKRKYQHEAMYNAPPIPDIEQVDPRAQPNMARLNVISADKLSRSPSRLGSGAFGIVYGGYWWPEGKSGAKVPVAIKIVQQEASGKAQVEMLAEAGLMASMRHPHLLRLVGICLSDGLQLITPLRPLGNLLEFLQKHERKLGSLDLMRYCHQIACAMEYLERHRLVHRDLAARNVLVKGAFHIEVTDFGLAKMLDYGEHEVHVDGRVAIKWLAYECLQYRCFTHASDVWAFGVTCWEVLTFGLSPYQGIPLTQIREHLKRGERLPQPDNCSQELYQTLLQCWMEKPECRPNFLQLSNTFGQYLRRPQLYIQDRRHGSTMRMESFNEHEQRNLINELLQDNDMNFIDPVQYFDEDDASTSMTNTTAPDTPTSPTSSTKPLMPRTQNRLQSTGSSRYQSDPLNHNQQQQRNAMALASTSIDSAASTAKYSIATDDGNYLVPNARGTPSSSSSSAVAYTPVVIHENGESDFIRKGGEYYNELRSETAPILLTAVDNKQYMAVVADVIESETTV